MQRKKRLLNLSGATQITANATVAASHLDVVRKRLHSGVEATHFGSVWGDIIRVVGDTVKMAGSGLV